MKALNFTANDTRAAVPFMEECKPSSLSLPPIRRVVDSTKLTDSISQSESLPGSMECLSSASSGGCVKAEPVIDGTDYTGVEPKARLNRSDDTEEGTEWKTACGMTKEEKDRLSNMKEEEEEKEEGGERQSVKMERDDGVKYSEGLGREQEKVKDEQQRNGVTEQTCQTHRCEKKRGKSEYGQQEEAGISTLVTACLLEQPRVLICRLKIADISVSVSPPPPHPMASKEDWGVKVPHTLEGSCSLRRKGQVMTRKRKMIGQLEIPQKQLPAPSENRLCVEASHKPLVISPRNQNTGRTFEASSQVFACSQCPFFHSEQLNLHQHIEKVHPEELRWTLKVSEGSGGEKLSKSRTHQHPKPTKTVPTPTQAHPGTSGAHTCPQCGKSFKFKSMLTKHQRAHSRERPYHCSQCGKSFKYSACLKAHQKTHTGDSPYQCTQCGKTLISKSGLKIHQQIHTGERQYHCSQCGLSFTQLSNLNKHQRIHTGERPHHCSQCGKNFRELADLIRHQRVHTRERPFHCSQCGKSFRCSRYLKAHQKSHTGESPYQCTQCGKTFISKSGLKIHQRSHTDDRPYHCSQCGKNFKLKPSLTVHQRTHTGERPYHCTQCGKGFGTSTQLATHQRIHTGERPYHCSQCGKSFMYSTCLKEHQKTHTGESPYQCTQCGKNFNRSAHLTRHQRIHTGERPYSCSQCGESFRWSNILKAHQQAHTK
ncbi:zinc finger protein 345-like isoform X1 [Anguilla anguilla]|uniref:zinc finger protein 345-like isoform X1 n=2 Tax=Anguilla anguilla TaxID=7936 RepID=UPI0015A7B5B3|nr:zinc finger protein 345-like isoform X1 [Anguilla anguilla]